MKECQPEQQRKGKKILIKEVEEDDDGNGETKLTGKIVKMPP